MENATKALEMAGSVLIGVLILGCLVFVYSKIAETKKVEENSKRAQQATDFNKEYEAYNRQNLYGSDIFSVANMIENYNKKEAETKDYGKIEIKAIVKNEIRGAQFFVKSVYDEKTISEAYKKLTKAINKENKEYFGKKVSYWSNFGTSTRLENQLLQELR